MSEVWLSVHRSVEPRLHVHIKHGGTEGGLEDEERGAWGLRALLIGGLFTGQSHGLCHYVISVMSVRVCSKTRRGRWLHATRRLGTGLGKELRRGSHLGYSW